MYTQKEKDLLIGLIIGDGCLHKNKKGYFSLSIRHGGIQKDYLEHKTALLNSFKIFNNTLKVKERETKLNDKVFMQYEIQKTDKKLEEIYRIMQSGIKETLKNIKSDRSVALWFMDDGCVLKNPRKLSNGTYHLCRPSIKLCTHCFSYEENVIIAEWFYKKYLIKPSVCTEKKKDKTYYFLKFGVDITEKVYKIIKPYIVCCNSMEQKFSRLTEYYK